jgi:hypothetical protein
MPGRRRGRDKTLYFCKASGDSNVVRELRMVNRNSYFRTTSHCENSDPKLQLNM